jgi:hypothetical protein
MDPILTGLLVGYVGFSLVTYWVMVTGAASQSMQTHRQRLVFYGGCAVVSLFWPAAFVWAWLVPKRDI